MSPELLELAKKIVEYQDEGTPSKDAIESSEYSTEEVLYHLAAFYIAHKE